jgi:hypothetical protein
MRSLKSPWPAHALTTLETVLKQPQEARLFRRAHAVCTVVAGSHVNAVPAMCHLTNSALRTGDQRFANAGAQSWLDRPRSGRPRKGASALEKHLNPRSRSQDEPQDFYPGVRHHTSFFC